jgi:hypothetical protein
MEFWELRQMRDLPLEVRTAKAKAHIREWHRQIYGGGERS